MIEGQFPWGFTDIVLFRFGSICFIKDKLTEK